MASHQLSRQSGTLVTDYSRGETNTLARARTCRIQTMKSRSRVVHAQRGSIVRNKIRWPHWPSRPFRSLQSKRSGAAHLQSHGRNVIPSSQRAVSKRFKSFSCLKKDWHVVMAFLPRGVFPNQVLPILGSFSILRSVRVGLNTVPRAANSKTSSCRGLW